MGNYLLDSGNIVTQTGRFSSSAGMVDLDMRSENALSNDGDIVDLTDGFRANNRVMVLLDGNKQNVGARAMQLDDNKIAFAVGTCSPTNRAAVNRFACIPRKYEDERRQVSTRLTRKATHYQKEPHERTHRRTRAYFEERPPSSQFRGHDCTVGATFGESQRAEM